MPNKRTTSCQLADYIAVFEVRKIVVKEVIEISLIV